MKQYQSHKVVSAFLISEVVHTELGAELFQKNGDAVAVDTAYLEKHQPYVGGYYVRYADGYESFSPAEAFEDGYSEIGQAGLSLPSTSTMRHGVFTVLQIAELAHNTNMSFRDLCSENLGAPWIVLSEEERQHVIEGVKLHLSLGYVDPASSHNHWVFTKLRDGWTYGENKDAQARTHPNLVPFEELSAKQQAKDYLFGGIVSALAPFIRQE